MREIVFDLETQKEFAEVGRRNPHLLKISVAGVFDYGTDKFLTFEESELKEFEKLIRGTSRLIGFNIKAFDIPVLQPYISFDLSKIPMLDIMEEIEKVVGFRVGLDNIARPTLNEGKSGSGLKALEYWREGRIEELKKYCLDDVRLTRDVYEYAKANKKLFFLSRDAKIEEIPIELPLIPNKKDENQDALF